MTLMPIKKDFIIEKRNVLNEMRTNNMTLQELRFFSIYLSKINPRDKTTRLVRFSLSEFEKIMELVRIQSKDIKPVVDSLLCKIIHVPTENGGFSAFQLFKECKVDQDQNGVWYVEIDAHDKALPLMFEFKTHYFTYQLWNALRLKSSNQLRMYELLKQFEKKGERILTLLELRSLLGIGPGEYPRWERFKAKVLDSCQTALAETTDIKYTYDPIKNGRGGKVTGIKFTIEKNKDYIDQLTLFEFIEFQDQVNPDDLEEAGHSDELLGGENKNESSFKNERLELYSEMCNYEFSEQEIQILYDLLLDIVPVPAGSSLIEKDLKRVDYLKRAYNELEYRATQRKVSNRFGYLRGILGNKLKEKEE